MGLRPAPWQLRDAVADSPDGNPGSRVDSRRASLNRPNPSWPVEPAVATLLFFGVFFPDSRLQRHSAHLPLQRLSLPGLALFSGESRWIPPFRPSLLR